MTQIENDYYLQLPSGRLTQGDVCRNLPFPHGHTPSCTGVIITPRCDLAHDKSPVINYLPILSLEEIIELQGGFSLLEQEQRKALDQLRKHAQPMGVSELLDIGVPPSRVLAHLEQTFEVRGDNSGDPRFLNDLEGFRGAFERWVRISGCLERVRLNREDISSLLPAKEVKRFKMDVIRNRILDLHFFPPCTALLPEPSAALFRLIATSSIALLNKALNCVNQKAWERIRKEMGVQEFEAYTEKPERILRLRSPYLEYLMSRFAALFGRVGVPDLAPEIFDSYLAEEE